MSSSSPLSGVVLVDCAKANATQGMAIAARQCGYENDIDAFRTALKKACSDMGVEIDSLTDLISDSNPVNDPTLPKT